MAFIFVQMLLALLLVAHVCMCTKQDPNRIAAGVVRQIDDSNKQNFLSPVTDVSNERTRRKRSYEIDITDTVNSLRSYIGASDMNYLTNSNSLETEAVNWTGHCDYDAILYSNVSAIFLRKYSGSPINHVSVLGSAFTSRNIGLRSVELRSVGAAYSFCSNARVDGVNDTNVYLAAYVFSTTSDFNDSVIQYTLGEACTTCLSGSYWCLQGLCKDDCSVSDSNCYCNSYCMNCADTNQTTCTCQCLEGWTGSRCETRDDNVMNVTEPTCSTTVRVPITRTTMGTTTITVAPTTTNSRKNVAPVIHPLIHQLLLCATMALFLILYR